MVWLSVGTTTVTKGWTYTAPATGSLFRVQHLTPTLKRRGVIAQAAPLAPVQLFQIQGLYAKSEYDLYQFVQPDCWESRVLALRGEDYAEIFSSPWKVALDVWQPNSTSNPTPTPTVTYSAAIAALNPWYSSEDTLTSGFLIDPQLTNPTAYTYICRFVATSTANGGFFGFDDKHGFTPPGPSDRALYFDSGKIKLYNYNGGAYYLTTPNSYEDAIPHTLTARMGGGLPTAIFVDGVKVIETATTGAYNYSGYYKAGYAYEGGSISGCSIIKPAIFLSALTDAQIISIHQAS